MASVHDVAAAIITRLGPTDNMKLQKLLFFAQGWSLAWRGEPLFDESIEAWELGPVVDAAYQVYKDYRWHEIDAPRSGDPGALSEEDRQTLAAVLDLYGAMSGRDLSELTHGNAAWAEAYARRHAPVRSRQIIDPDKLVRALRRGQSTGQLTEDAEVELRQLVEPAPH